MVSDSARNLQRASALARWALTPDADRRAHASRAQRGLEARFGAAVDEALPGLDPEERARRIAKLRSAYFAQLVGERQRNERVRAQEAARATAPRPERPLHPRFQAAMQAAFGDEINRK